MDNIMQNIPNNCSLTGQKEVEANSQWTRKGSCSRFWSGFTDINSETVDMSNNVQRQTGGSHVPATIV